MLCNNKLSNSSLAPAKLREHFAKVHGTRKYAGTLHDQFKQKRARFDAHASITSHGFVPVDKPILTASYEMVYLIGKHGKPHTIGEPLVKPMHCEWLGLTVFQANIMLGTAAKDKLSLVPLSTEIVKNRIDDISENILHQVVADLKASHTKFSLQLDETTDAANLSQLITFVRYATGDKIKEEFLFSKHLTTTAKAIDVKKILDDFFTNNGLTWSMVLAVYTDGAHAMMGCNSALRGLIKGDAPHITITHCVLHRHALMSKTLPVLEPRCNRAAWVRSRFEPQELIDVQLERQLATRYLHDVVFASTKLLYTTSFYQSLGFIAAK